MEHEDFRTLDPFALKVFMVLGSQFNGRNNGDLSATFEMLKHYGGMSKGRLAKSLRELRDRNLIHRTRDHIKHRSRAQCALYALSWRPVDDLPHKNLDENAVGKCPRSLS